MKSNEGVRRSYAELTQHFVKVRRFQDNVGSGRNPSSICLKFTIGANELERFEKAFIRNVVNAGSTYNIQSLLHLEDYFTIKTTSLGSNLCLLEESEEGELHSLMEGPKECSS